MPLFDVDTEMTFLYGRGSSFLHFYHVDASADASPFRPCATWHADTNVIDAAATPKRGLRLMDAEVNRVLVLTRHSLLPVSWIPARKNYKEFHEDLFPPTRGRVAACDAAAWLAGNVALAADEALKPGKRKTTMTTTTTTTDVKTDHKQNSNGNGSPAVIPSTITTPSSPPTSPSPRISAPPKPSPLAGLFVSKFKHVKMEVAKKSRWIENLPALATTVPGASDMFAVNEKRFAVPLKGVGGGGGARILVVDFSLNFDGKRLEVRMIGNFNCCPVSRGGWVSKRWTWTLNEAAVNSAVLD